MLGMSINVQKKSLGLLALFLMKLFTCYDWPFFPSFCTTLKGVGVVLSSSFKVFLYKHILA